MSEEKKFNQSKYIQQYTSKNYKRIQLLLKPNHEQNLAEYSQKSGLSANQIFIRAMLYCKMYDIDLTAINPDK